MATYVYILYKYFVILVIRFMEIHNESESGTD